jgi:hypothetical protein
MNATWKTAQANVGNAVAEMNRLEGEGYSVVHVFPILVPRPAPSNVVDQQIFIAARKA